MSAPAPLPVIAAMIGDPAGVGPEVCAAAIASGELANWCRPLLIGNAGVMERAARIVGARLPVVTVASPAEARSDAICVLANGGHDELATCAFGASSAAAGHAVADWIDTGNRLGANGDIAGLVLGPVDTYSLKESGRIMDIDDIQPAGTFMLRLSGKMRAVPLSEHVTLLDAIALVRPERVLHVIRLINDTLKRWGIAAPRIAVAGLNPHAMFPDDQERIGPAIAAARAEGIDASGPAVPDSVFRQTLEGRYDVVITMFHDQGQIAIKTAGFEGACTVYVGLRYVMLNVPHGVAFDIAGSGKAQHQSMLAALRTAASLAAGRGLPE